MDINNIVNSTRMRNARLLDDINSKILNREYYKFKYVPLEGALSGLYFQQQTEDAINDIGNVAYATEKVADEALQVAQQAYNIALAALETANNALAAAQTAQQTANTALNIANNALSVGTAAATAAAVAQNRADEAYDLADAAQKAADAAQNTADAAQKAANNAANDATNALTKAEDALTKIEQLSVLNYYNNLTEATDVNTLVDVHRWYLQTSNNPNAPETNSGFLNVDNDYNDSVCKQLWVSETTGAIYNRFGKIVENSDPATVSSWSEWHKLATKADIDGTTTALTKKITTVANNLATHEADFDNPHKVTAEQLGLTTVYQYKGSVATYADLPTTGQKVGDVWNVETADPDHSIKAGDNVAWDGAQWDILGGNHDLSGYAQLNSANTYTALNTFGANIGVSNGTAAGSSGTVSFGVSPTGEAVQARIGTDKLGGLFYHASTNQPHVFRVGTNDNVFVIRDDGTKVAFSNNNNFFATVTHDGVAKWLGNANTATTADAAKAMALKENIPVNSNLNNYRVPGEYGINDSNTAATLINSPSVVAGLLTVTPFLTQIYQEYGGYSSSNIHGRRYIRGWYTSNSNIFWSPWRQLAYTSKTISGYGITDAYTKTEVNNLISSAGGGDVTAAGNNAFTGLNTFANETTFGNELNVWGSLTSRSSTGQINIGRVSGANGAYITGESGGGLALHTKKGQPLELLDGVDGNLAVLTTSQATIYPNIVQIGSDTLLESVGIRKATIGDYPLQILDGNMIAAQFNGNSHKAAFEASEVMINSSEISTNFAIKNASQNILDCDGIAMHLRTGNSSIGLELGSGASGWALQCPADATDVRVARRLYVGSQGGVGNGVISADNTENCLYFCGTAENTYYATPNTGNTISYQSSANCYLINCSINDPSSLNMNFSNMNFKATVGSVPYMCKTLTFWLPVGATVPAVTWTFPTGSAVYYPKGVAPTLTANANNIINVIAIVDDTDSFSIQVCDTVVLPYSG